MAKGLPDKVVTMLYLSFVKCDIFESDKSLRTFFDRDSLRPWRYRIHDGTSPLDRASKLVYLLQDNAYGQNVSQNWFDGMNALEVFLVELVLHYQGTSVDGGFTVMLGVFPEVKSKVLQLQNCK